MKAIDFKTCPKFIARDNLRLENEAPNLYPGIAIGLANEVSQLCTEKTVDHLATKSTVWHNNNYCNYNW